MTKKFLMKYCTPDLVPKLKAPDRTGRISISRRSFGALRSTTNKRWIKKRITKEREKI
jgi:hypothetical protein